MVVEGWLHRAARTHPQGVGVESPDGSRTYAELYDAALTGARALQARGVGAGDRVAIALAPGSGFAEAFHACLLLGAVAVPVDVRLGPAERALICDGAALIVEEPLSEASSTRTRGRTAGISAPAGNASPAPGRSHDLDAVAAVIHTSGTSAAPRPVELTYANFLWSALGSAVALDRDPCERWLCALPVSHVGGLSILVRSAIYATTAVVHERFDTQQVLEALREQDITLVSLVATTLGRLLDAGLQRPPALRCALTGGGPVPEALLARALQAGVPVSTTYGLTEACSQVTTMPVGRGSPAVGAYKKDALSARAPRTFEDTSSWETSSGAQHAGPPLFCTQVRIDGSSPEESGVGEIMVCGPTVAPGTRDRDGWLRTGDLGSLDERGFLRVTGRVADTIVSGGENVAPAEVEAVLESHPDVLEAAVLPRPDPRWGESVTAIVLARPGSDLKAEALRAHCAARLARYKVPKQVDFTSAPLPRTQSGKLLRREL
jgi:O-succinylbenzoic acid--CoA ligase